MQQKDEPLLTLSSTTQKSSVVGLGLIFFGSLCSVTSVVWAKFLIRENVSQVWIILVRAGVLFLSMGIFIWYDRIHGGSMEFLGPRKIRSILFIRAVCYFTVLSCIYWSVEYISASLTSIIYHTFPLFTAILSHRGCFSEPEKLSKLGWLCTLAGFLGIFCVVYFKEIDGNLVAGVILSTTASISYTFQLIIIRKTRLDVHWSQMEFVSACVWLYILIPCVLIGRYIINTAKHDHNVILNFDLKPLIWCELIGISIFNAMMLGSLTLGFQLEEAPRGAIITYIKIPLFMAAEYVLVGRVITWVEICGVVLTLCGVVGISVEKITKRRRQRFSIQSGQ